MNVEVNIPVRKLGSNRIRSVAKSVRKFTRALQIKSAELMSLSGENQIKNIYNA